MLDFNHGSQLSASPPTLCDRINEIIDAGIVRRRAEEKPRDYLGASAIGHPCDRKLWYDLMAVPPDPGREIGARQLRIFAAGHAYEDAVAETMNIGSNVFGGLAETWLSDAGFKLLTRNTAGEQFGFSAAGGRFRGHIDGAIVSGPLADEIPYPVGWEHKALNLKSWNKIKKYGIRVGNEQYYVQMQTYMAYMELTHFLFTATNKNTSELLHELVSFDPATAQRASDRAGSILTAAQNGTTPPRVASNSDYYVCSWCDRKARCWERDQ